MKTRRAVFLGAAFWAMSLACAGSTVASKAEASPKTRTQGLDSFVDRVLQQSGIEKSHVGIHVVHPDGPVLADVNGSKQYISASVMKIVTALAVLEELGPAHTFMTEVYADGGDNGPTIRGPLYLKGGGDPTFIAEKLWYTANELTRDGISTVEGGLVVDDTRFDSIRFDEGRLPSSEDRAFDAPVGALSFNWNSVNIFVKPGDRVGEPAKVVLDPVNDYVNLISRASTVAGAGNGKVSAHLSPRTGFGEVVKVEGNVGTLQAEYAVYRMISEPDLWTGSNFVSALKQRGIGVRGNVRKGTVPGSARLVRSTPGSPLRRVVDDMLKFSNNFVAEMLTKNLAAEKGEKPATMKTGIGVLKDYLSKWGIPSSGYQVVSPSGLSRRNLLTPSALVKVLKRAEKSFRAGPEFLGGLPVGGVDGTLKRRFQGDMARKVRAKTGMLDGVTTLAGYVELPDGRDAAFAFLYNGPKDPTSVQTAYDKICVEIAKGP